MAEYRDLPNGLTYLAPATVTDSKKQAQVKVENFDFARLAETK